MRSGSFSLLVGTILSVASTAWAGPPTSGAPGETQKSRSAQGTETAHRADRSGDGEVSAQEKRRVATIQVERDEARGGKSDEKRDKRGVRESVRGEPRGEHPSARDRLDRDGDGRLNESERGAAKAQFRHVMLIEFDANDNGVLDPAERARMKQLLREEKQVERLGGDQDRPEENSEGARRVRAERLAHARQTLKALFDGDGDGSLSDAEMHTMDKYLTEEKFERVKEKPRSARERKPGASSAEPAAPSPPK